MSRYSEFITNQSRQGRSIIAHALMHGSTRPAGHSVPSGTAETGLVLRVRIWAVCFIRPLRDLAICHLVPDGTWFGAGCVVFGRKKLHSQIHALTTILYKWEYCKDMRRNVVCS